jgi:NTP pyrophosphatase (non-canonical NTP hydrolase)
MSDLKDLSTRAQAIRQKYNELNAASGRDAWGGKEYAMGLVGDVGDLLKIVMAKENLRDMDDIDTKLAHELSDCLWSVFVLAAHYGVDLEKEFLRTMDQLEQRIAKA